MKEHDPLQITATQFKLNLGKYLNLVLTEDIWITRNGKIPSLIGEMSGLPV